MMMQSGLAQQPWGARPPLAKPPTHKYRARWASVHKIHSLFADGFPELEQRYVRERDAAERVYEYNLGTIEREPGGIDETGALRAAFRAVWKSKFYGAFVLNRRLVLHAIDATPAR